MNARDRLLEALCLSTPPCQDHLDDLCEILPVVEALCAERAAEELDDLAALIDRGPTFPMPPSIFSELARERAAASRAGDGVTTRAGAAALTDGAGR